VGPAGAVGPAGPPGKTPKQFKQFATFHRDASDRVELLELYRADTEELITTIRPVFADDGLMSGAVITPITT
jgi:hypothetical protein